MVALVEVRRGEVFLVDLNPTRGNEIRKTRPCVVVSPDELNEHLTIHYRAAYHGWASISLSYRVPFRGKGRSACARSNPNGGPGAFDS